MAKIPAYVTHDSLKEAYVLLHASSPGELAKKFIKEDQRLLRTQTWSYRNPKLVLNKVKEIVEKAVDDGFTTGNKEGDDDLRDMLWFWYHHAIGYAIWDHGDQTEAQEFSTKALKYQTADNKNQITRLLYLLVRNRDAEAAAWLETIVDEPDKTASYGVMNEYLAGNFFKQ